MSKRYYLCDVIGDGTEDNPFRPAVADYGVNWSGSIPTGEDGRPTTTWALVIVGAKDHAQLRKDARLDALPDFPLDGKVSAVNTASRNALTAAMSKRGVPTSGLQLADGYRDAIRQIGKSLDPAFDENKFDVADA